MRGPTQLIKVHQHKGRRLQSHIVQSNKQLQIQADDRPSEETDFAVKLEQLTPQKFTVLKMMSDGLFNKLIAYELAIKETTIEQHGSAILRKFGLNNYTQAGVLLKKMMGI